MLWENLFYLDAGGFYQTLVVSVEKWWSFYEDVNELLMSNLIWLDMYFFHILFFGGYKLVLDSNFFVFIFLPDHLFHFCIYSLFFPFWGLGSELLLVVGEVDPLIVLSLFKDPVFPPSLTFGVFNQDKIMGSVWYLVKVVYSIVKNMVPLLYLF